MWTLISAFGSDPCNLHRNIYQVLCIEDTLNNVDVDDGHTDGHADNVDDGHTDGHADTRTCSDVVSRGMI